MGMTKALNLKRTGTTMEQPSGKKTESASASYKSVSEFRVFSEAMLVIAEQAPERMTMSQVIFFILTATAELAGRQPTYSDVKAAVGDKLNKSLHTTYRILMEPSLQFPKGLGWLTSELNPADNRVKFLRMTPKGRRVMDAVLQALKGD